MTKQCLSIRVVPESPEIHKPIPTPQTAKPTHKLVISLIPLPWANWNALKSLFDKIISVVNPVIERLGWKALYCKIEGNNLVIYLRKLGSLMLITAVIVAIASLLLMAGFVIEQVRLYKVETGELELQKSNDEIFREVTNKYANGEISKDQYLTIAEALNKKEEAQKTVEQQPAPAPSISRIFSLILNILPIALMAFMFYMLFNIVKPLLGGLK